MFLRGILVVLSVAAIAEGERRVIGGNDAPNHKFPYVISLRHRTYRHICGGSILNKRWILTAAHCIENVFNPEDLMISAGTNFLNENGTVYEPNLLVSHDQYKNHQQYDIALIRVKKDIVFTDFVKPIDIPIEDLQDYRKTAVYAGWGFTDKRKVSSNKLQEIYLNLLADEKCQELYPVTKRHVCTFTKPGHGICHNDSGGPLVINGVQVGIASYSKGECAANPDVWTRVFSYRGWILKTMKKNSSD